MYEVIPLDAELDPRLLTEARNVVLGLEGRNSSDLDRRVPVVHCTLASVVFDKVALILYELASSVQVVLESVVAVITVEVEKSTLEEKKQ